MGNTAKDFFTEKQKEDIKIAVQNAELETSGEIRVHIENECDGDVLDRAATVFEKLGMSKTQQRNGILFYLAVKNRKFAIIGDEGINVNVPEDYWEMLKMKMLNHFREGNFTEGLVDAINRVGLELKKYFPYQADDVNELSDDISFGK
ncbi:MAG: TPM domain-containing protein [Bacteroidales bacterium]|mgnify:CR=1 FL=1